MILNNKLLTTVHQQVLYFCIYLFFVHFTPSKATMSRTCTGLLGVCERIEKKGQYKNSFQLDRRQRLRLHYTFLGGREARNQKIILQARKLTIRKELTVTSS